MTLESRGNLGVDGSGHLIYAWRFSKSGATIYDTNLNMTLESDIAAWFKQRAETSEFNGSINSILREAIHSKDFEDVLRKLTHEEMQQV